MSTSSHTSPLSSYPVVIAHIDDPKLHQGRVRRVPYVEGHWPTHVYLPITLSPRHNAKLYLLLKRAMKLAQSEVPELQTFFTSPSVEGETFPGDERSIELHVSLSRPVSLRAHQREDLRRSLSHIAKRQRRSVYGH